MSLKFLVYSYKTVNNKYSNVLHFYDYVIFFVVSKRNKDLKNLGKVFKFGASEMLLFIFQIKKIYSFFQKIRVYMTNHLTYYSRYSYNTYSFQNNSCGVV